MNNRMQNVITTANSYLEWSSQNELNNDVRRQMNCIRVQEHVGRESPALNSPSRMVIQPFFDWCVAQQMNANLQFVPQIVHFLDDCYNYWLNYHFSKLILIIVDIRRNIRRTREWVIKVLASQNDFV